MALIKCPVCHKRISSQASRCQHCQADLSGNTESLARISHIQQSNRLMNQSFLALTLFIAGVVLWFWGGEPAEGPRAYIAGGCFALGFVGYMITRVRIILHKRKSV
ncbi:zinc ribbon domain-containing protein [Shewanella sp. AS16]|uniref:zinc ribbon domain-containing protein n=1 Tax=Shewanella sp. AS16 TaxID=2907625 RepID=UPI001F24A391|nr:zinc ribbon domain-containing protein [Shewanella sp. AS16]MCE9687245.1 zinc ribbon domain-containing protein [Shewanella sp. AS16]